MLRWDPEKSTRTKWETTYASELQIRGLTQDFTGLSELLLGQAQPAQFQSADQTGYWWGSKVSDDGSYTELESPVSNQNSEIPRSYIRTPGGLYSWYAATAESGKYETAEDSRRADDSLYPRGWHIPVISQQNESSWSDLFVKYGLISADDAGAIPISNRQHTKLPLSLDVQAGYLSMSTGIVANYPYTLWSPYSAKEQQQRAAVFWMDYNSIQTAVAYSKASGVSIRCVLN